MVRADDIFAKKGVIKECEMVCAEIFLCRKQADECVTHYMNHQYSDVNSINYPAQSIVEKLPISGNIPRTGHSFLARYSTHHTTVYKRRNYLL